jgi:hypothetical protein
VHLGRENKKIKKFRPYFHDMAIETIYST